jgi:hypothetical protein
MNTYYKLIGRIAVPCDVAEFSPWFATSIDQRIVGKTAVGPMVVSTVFIGLDHNFGGGDPHLFETLVFDDGDNQIVARYHTWDEAERGHAVAVRFARRKLAAANALLNEKQNC